MCRGSEKSQTGILSNKADGESEASRTQMSTVSSEYARSENDSDVDLESTESLSDVCAKSTESLGSRLYPVKPNNDSRWN